MKELKTIGIENTHNNGCTGHIGWTGETPKIDMKSLKVMDNHITREEFEDYMTLSEERLNERIAREEMVNCLEIQSKLLRDYVKRNRSLLKQMYYLRQRIAGILLLALALISIPFLGGNGIALVFFVPMAVYLIFQRQMFRLAKNLERRWSWWRLKALRKKK